MLCACGDEPIPGQPTPLAQLGSDAKDAVCDWAVRCKHVPDRLQCERLIDPKDYDIRRALDAVAAGRLSYDEVLGGGCVDANRNQACLSGPWSNEFCRRMFDGLVEVGGPCTSGFECPQGSVCEDATCGAQCCLGQCGPIVPIDFPEIKTVGERCTSPFECDDDSFCNDNGRCAPLPLEVGERCLFGCGLGNLYCDLDELVCKRFGDEGEACDPDALLLPACDEAWSYCDEVCRPRPGPGQACDEPDAGPRQCTATSFCIAGLCRSRGEPGAPCTVGDQCTVACDPGIGACVDYQSCTLTAP